VTGPGDDRDTAEVERVADSMVAIAVEPPEVQLQRWASLASDKRLRLNAGVLPITTIAFNDAPC
jgi:hypothetical protein